MTTTLIIALVLAWSIQTVRLWIYRRNFDKAVQLNSELLEMNSDLEKSLAGAKTVNKILLRDKHGEDDYTIEDYWPEFIERKVS